MLTEMFLKHEQKIFKKIYFSTFFFLFFKYVTLLFQFIANLLGVIESNFQVRHFIATFLYL